MKRALLVCFLAGFSNAFPQDWAVQMEDPQMNFYELQKSFEKYWSTLDKSSPGNGYKAFRRWRPSWNRAFTQAAI